MMGAAAVFFAMHAAPGDPALTALGENASTETIAAFRARWHLDQPLPLQFVLWLVNALHGDLGQSISIASGTSVFGLIADRLPNTLFIGIYAIVLAVLISIAAGTAAALNRGGAVDTVATSVAAVGISMPDFWIGYVLVYAFALGLGWFPAYGFVSPLESVPGALHSGLLPALAIAAPMAASFTRILRSALIDNAHRDHVRVALSLGHGRSFVFLHHIMRNALIPYFTVIGLQVRYLLGGTVVIERIFGVNGLGSLMIDAAFGRDYPIVQACALTFLLIVLLANVIIDTICTALNPRMR
ncbi:ABC transporter permease [Bradyrhizobium sp. 142]|nr:ABC transporter permease [Bradyrhizobium sp. 142]